MTKNNQSDQVKLAVIATGFDETRRTLQGLTRPMVQTPTTDDTSQTQVPPTQPPTQEPPPTDDTPPAEDQWDIPAFLRQRS